VTGSRRPALRGDDVISTGDGVASVIVDGQAVLYDEAAKVLHVLDPIGTVVWQCLDGSGTLGEIEADLADVYQMPIKQVRTDVRRLIRQLDRLDLLNGVRGGVHRAPPLLAEDTAADGSPRMLEEPPNP
jgi:hypothetical protein